MSLASLPLISTGQHAPEPRIESITESVWSTMDLDGSEQALLEAAGKSLARGTDRYGVPQLDSQASLVQVRRIDTKSAQVRVLDATGLIATPTLQLNVQPKIPVSHLLHILQAAEFVPRFATGAGLLGESQN